MFQLWITFYNDHVPDLFVEAFPHCINKMHSGKWDKHQWLLRLSKDCLYTRDIVCGEGEKDQYIVLYNETILMF